MALRKFATGQSGTLFRLACSLKTQGLPDNVIMMVVKQTNEAGEDPIDGNEIEHLVEGALSHTGDKAKHHKLEPAFRMLIEHTESMRTFVGLRAMKAVMQWLNCDKLSISIREDGTVHIQISGDDRGYSIWHYSNRDAEVSGFDLPEQGDPIKTDYYDTRDGVKLSNGWLRGGESYGN